MTRSICSDCVSADNCTLEALKCKNQRRERRCPHCGGKIVKRGSEYYCFSCHFWWESEDGKDNADQES